MVLAVPSWLRKRPHSDLEENDSGQPSDSRDEGLSEQVQRLSHDFLSQQHLTEGAVGYLTKSLDRVGHD